MRSLFVNIGAPRPLSKQWGIAVTLLDTGARALMINATSGATRAAEITPVHKWKELVSAIRSVLHVRSQRYPLVSFDEELSRGGRAASTRRFRSIRLGDTYLKLIKLTQRTPLRAVLLIPSLSKR